MRGGRPRTDPPDDPLAWLEREPAQRVHSRQAFQQQLDAIDVELCDIAMIVSTLVEPVTAAFLRADVRAAGEIVAADDEVDARGLGLEDECLALLARQAPVAGDLRRVVAVLRSIADVQRAGDLLGHVAASLAWVHPPSMPRDLRAMIGRLGVVAGDVFAGAVAAWAAHDALAAVELQALDDEVDHLQKSLLTSLYSGGHSAEDAVSVALICRYYERIADHGVEMARQVTYFVTGERPAPA
ncbi:MAG: phosphate transport system regulatory protein PhoU [Nitriliruptorales bacterium]|nr:phosphate transport system regulatory protein PhoU [Nitriliruptorales bacterium]